MNLSLPAGQRVGCEPRGRVWGPVDRFLPRDAQDAARDGAETFPRATDLRSLSQCCARYSCVLPSSLPQRHCVGSAHSGSSIQPWHWLISHMPTPKHLGRETRRCQSAATSRRNFEAKPCQLFFSNAAKLLTRGFWWNSRWAEFGVELLATCIQL